MVSYFEADVKCLQDPYVKLSALFLAIIATFSRIIRKIKLIFICIRTINPSPKPLLQYLNKDFDFSDDVDNEFSSVSSNEDELTHTVFSRDQQPVDQDFTVLGTSFYFRKQGQESNLRLRGRRSSYQRFPVTEFVTEKSVVKVWDLNKQQKMSNLMFFPCEARDVKNGVVLAAYDTRMKGESPAICAEWGTGKVVGINGGEKFYVRDEVAGILTVGDMRKVKTPVETVSENNGDRWWDAGAVIVDDDFVDRSKCVR